MNLGDWTQATLQNLDLNMCLGLVYYEGLFLFLKSKRNNRKKGEWSFHAS
jgi:hypothetical protein